MTVAAFVLGIVGTVLAAASLGWQVWSFVLQGGAAETHAGCGHVDRRRIVTNDATRDVRDALRAARPQCGEEVSIH